MLVKFYADQHNARFVWGWEDGQYTTDDPAEIDNLKGIGLRYKVINVVKENLSLEEAKELVKPIPPIVVEIKVDENKPKKRRRKPKAK